MFCTSFKRVLNVIDFQLRTGHTEYSLVLEACEKRKSKKVKEEHRRPQHAQKSTWTVPERDSLTQQIKPILVVPKRHTLFIKSLHFSN